MIGCDPRGWTSGHAPATEYNGAGGRGGPANVTGGVYYSYAGASGGAGRCEIEWRV
jgi:hypothetical protein